eukprot:scaffold3808_cov112-Isochrysis_galbana.AAC.34
MALTTPQPPGAAVKHARLGPWASEWRHHSPLAVLELPIRADSTVSLARCAAALAPPVAGPPATAPPGLVALPAPCSSTIACFRSRSSSARSALHQPPSCRTCTDPPPAANSKKPGGATGGRGRVKLAATHSVARGRPCGGKRHSEFCSCGPYSSTKSSSPSTQARNVPSGSRARTHAQRHRVLPPSSTSTSISSPTATGRLGSMPTAATPAAGTLDPPGQRQVLPRSSSFTTRKSSPLPSTPKTKRSPHRI